MPVLSALHHARDRRIDLLRGLALLAVFIDHIPGNVLQLATLQSHALSDAAEIFVFLAGYSAWISYGRTLERDGVWAGTQRVLARCGRIYVVQAAMVGGCVVLASMWHPLADLEPGLSIHVDGATLARVLALYAQPAYFNVLPLYVCLLLAFPLVWVGLRRMPRTTVVASATLWLLVGLKPGINLPQWMAGQGWVFNPFAWQFLFMLGAVAAAMNTAWGRPIRPIPRLTAVCLIFLVEIWLLLRCSNLVHPSSPSDVASRVNVLAYLIRLLSGLAVMYLALTSKQFGRLAASGVLQAVEVCGKHSLVVFGLGSLLSLAGRLTFQAAGTTWPVQVLVNCIGLSMLVAVAAVLERRRHEARMLPRLVRGNESAVLAS